MADWTDRLVFAHERAVAPKRPTVAFEPDSDDFAFNVTGRQASEPIL